MTACDEGAVWPASHAPLEHVEEDKKEEVEKDKDVRVVSTTRQKSLTKPTWAGLFCTLPF